MQKAKAVIQSHAGFLTRPCIMLGVSQVFFFAYTFFKGSSEQYLPLLLPIFAASMLLLIVCRYTQGSYGFTIAWVELLQIGILLQVLLGSTSYHEMVILLALSSVCVIAAPWLVAIVQACMQKHKKWIWRGGIAITMLLYLTLLLFGRSVNGTRAWLGNMSITMQPTELAKVVSLLLMALPLAEGQATDLKRYIDALIVVAINALFLILINELGTLLLIGATFLIMCLLFLPFRYSALNLGIVALAVLACVFLIFLGANGDQAQSANLLFKIGRKLNSRITVFLNPQSDPLGEGYQASRARMAMAVGGLLGSDQHIHVPVLTTDFAFVGLLMNMGAITGLCVIVLFAALLIYGMRISISQGANRFQQILCAGFVFSIFLQAALIIGGSTGFLPCTGIPVPFLSKGGTYHLVLSGMLGCILHVSGKYPLQFPIFNNKGGQKNGNITRKNHVAAEDTHGL